MIRSVAGHNHHVINKIRAMSLLLIASLVASCGFCGCVHRIAGNFPHCSYIDFSETENGFSVPYYEIDVQNKLCMRSGGYTESDDVLYGGTAEDLDWIVAPSGYENVVPYIEALALDANYPVVHTCGYLSDGKLHGFVNVYKDTVGYLSGGGNYAVEEISHGVIFEYLPETDSFTVKQRFDGCNIVAYNADTVIYWKNKQYYSYDLLTQTENFLIKDMAYDSGIQHQSYTRIYTNSAYTVLLMTKAHLTREVYYYYLYDYSTGCLYELECCS